VAHEGSTKAILAAFAANLGIALSKLAAFAVTGASSLLAESIHSFADSGNQGLLLLGGKRGGRAPDEQHPFGHGRERYFWSFVVALVLFSVGGLFAVYEGVHKVANPEALSNPLVAFVVLGVAVGLEAFSLRTAVHETRAVKPADQSYWQFIRRTKLPELPVVLLEDVGALIGLAFALLGLTLAEITGQPRFDGIGSIAIGLLLITIAAILAREMKSLLIGESADEHVVALLTTALSESPDVRTLIHLRTLQLGPEDLLVAAKLELDPSLDYAALARAIDATEVRVRAAVPEARLVFLEPDVRAPAPA